MTIDWQKLLSENMSAMFALIGTCIGAVLAFLSGYFLKKREFKLAISTKIIDRRINAQEKVLDLATDMRFMLSPGGTDLHGEMPRFPKIMNSKEDFQLWFLEYSEKIRECTTWLSTETKRECNFVQDYLATIHTNLANVPSDKYKKIGAVLRDDFIALSSSLEKSAMKYFQNDLYKLKPDSLDKWHKYKRSETEARLNALKISKEWITIQGIINE